MNSRNGNLEGQNDEYDENNVQLNGLRSSSYIHST